MSLNTSSNTNLIARHRTGRVWQVIFNISTLVGIVALIALLYNIVNSAFGYVIVEYTIPPESLTRDGMQLSDQNVEQLTLTFQENVSKGLFRRFEAEGAFENPTEVELQNLIFEWVLEAKVVEQWGFWESLQNRTKIEKFAEEEFPNGTLEMRSWLNPNFIVSPQSESAIKAGVRTAILGSLWTIIIAILFAFPLGVGAAVYLEEYANDSRINRIIQTNINNLAGVPSIIYGLLGLAIFVRALESITSGAVFGILEDPTSANGRTILSAGLTLGLLVLPMIIINAQESIRSVPQSLRLASYGLGATKWQTIWAHVLPNAISGILTGTILAISRAIGETAPLVVVGASTFIREDPSGPFSKFTTLPIQIYQWTARPQDVFRNIAAAAILVLLIMLISLNATAVLLRNRYTRRL